MLISFKEPEMLAGVLLGVEQGGQIFQDIQVYEEGITLSGQQTIDHVQKITGGDDYKKTAGDHTGAKRQTIREFDWENPNLRSPHNNSMPGDTAHIWWKSRTKNRFKIGQAKIIAVHDVEIMNIDDHVHIRVYGSRSEIIKIQSSFVISDINSHQQSLTVEAFARRDGFRSVPEFRDYFVPRPGNVFKGVLTAW